MMKTITFLPLEELRVLKQVILVSDITYNKDVSIGYLLYERKFSPMYKLKETPPEEKDLSYYLEYPKQDHFPTDRLDEIILQSVRNLLPKSIVRNSAVLTNLDEEYVERLLDRPLEKSQITFTPNLTSIDFTKISGRSFSYLRKKVNIYNNFRKEKIQNLAFTGYYDPADMTILNELNTIKFL